MKGFIALALQATFIGWIPASIWAWKFIRPEAESAPKPTAKQSPTQSTKR